jgi:hypothetical protein
MLSNASSSVNMYASCWILTKVENVPTKASRDGSVDLEKLEI